MKGMNLRLKRFHWRFMAAGAGLLFAGFVAAYYLAFPQTVLRQRIEYELALRCPYPTHLQQAALRPPLTLSLEGITVEDLPCPVKTLTVQQVKLKPRWLSVFTGEPGITFDATIQQAGITGSWQGDGQVAVNIQDLPLSPWLPETLGLNLSGIVREGTIQARLNDPAKPPVSSSLQSEVSGLILTGLQKYGLSQDQIRFGTAHIVTSSKNGRLNIEQLIISGGDLDISVAGSILLSSPISHSRLNLNLSLRPSSTLDPAAAELLSAMAKPAADGSFLVTITGTAARPKLK